MGILVNIIRKDTFQNKIMEVQDDALKKEEFIKNYLPFIIKTVSQVTGRYVEVENDHYFSIALEAFNTAIDTYKTKKNKFIPYARKVISNKIIDEIRKERTKTTIYLEDLNDCEEHSKYTSHKFSCNMEKRLIQSEEIHIFKRKLKEHSITFQDLLVESPKHHDTRKRCYNIADTIKNDAECRDGIWTKAKFLRKRISYLTNASEKVLKRNRKFIIASSIILIGKLDTLIQYMDLDGGEDSV